MFLIEVLLFGNTGIGKDKIDTRGRLENGFEDRGERGVGGNVGEVECRGDRCSCCGARGRVTIDEVDVPGLESGEGFVPPQGPSQRLHPL